LQNIALSQPAMGEDNIVSIYCQYLTFSLTSSFLKCILLAGNAKWFSKKRMLRANIVQYLHLAFLLNHPMPNSLELFIITSAESLNYYQQIMHINSK